MLSGASEARTQFIEANAASARALGAGDLPDINSQDIDELPLDLVAPATIQDIKLIRGLVDSLALIQVHHDAAIHAARLPGSAVAKRIFTAMERVRCEACCNRHHEGVAGNMSRLWIRTQVPLGRVDLADTEQLPIVFACFTREALTLPMPATESLLSLTEYWRSMVVTRTNQSQWNDLFNLVKEQDEFAAVANRLIESIEFINGKLDSPSDATTAAPGANDDSRDSDKDAGADDFEADESDDDNQSLTVSLRDEPDEYSDTTQSEHSESGPDDIALVNRDSPVSVDSESGTEVATGSAGGYRAYSTENDEIVVADRFCSAEDLALLRASLDTHLDRHARVVGKLSGKLQRVLMTQQQRHWKFDLDEGLLDSARLARVVSDPMAALSFKQESDVLFKDTVVTVLVDNSKSMLGKPIAIAAACSDLLSQTLERCGVSVEILGFTTTQLHGGDQFDRWKNDGAARNPGRLNGLRHIIYKAADTPYRRARRCFGLMLHKDLLKQNIDGEALLWACGRLQHRPERRKILLVISDGAPIDTSTMAANDGNFLIDHLHQVIASIENSGEVELIAIGIGHDVAGYYKNAMTILDARDLGRSMLAKLSSLFAAPA